MFRTTGDSHPCRYGHAAVNLEQVLDILPYHPVGGPPSCKRPISVMNAFHSVNADGNTDLVAIKEPDDGSFDDDASGTGKHERYGY